MKSFLLELREIALNCPDLLLRKVVRDTADEVDAAPRALILDTTQHNMKRLNGAWARAWRVADLAKPSPDDGPGGGTLQPEATLLDMLEAA
jgi:hypothetical protein